MPTNPIGFPHRRSDALGDVRVIGKGLGGRCGRECDLARIWGQREGRGPGRQRAERGE